MSYDVSLFFRDEAFPLGLWKEAIAEFRPNEREAQQPVYGFNVLAEWIINSNDGHLWLELRDVRADNYRKPISTRWEISITRSGFKPHNAWLQFAVPYQALVLIPSAIFCDPQHGLQIEDEREYLEFVAPELQKFGLSKMFDLGLLDAQGKPKF